MQKHALTQLIQDYTDALAFVGLELENQSSYYLNNRKLPTQIFWEGKNSESQSNFFQFLAQHFSRWSVKQCEILIEMLKDEHLRKGAQLIYVRVYCERLKDLAITVAYNQLKQKAIQQFTKMGRNEQIQYLAYYLQDTMHIFDNSEGTDSNYKHFDFRLGDFYRLGSEADKFLQNGTYLQGLNLGFLPPFGRNTSNEYLARDSLRQVPNFGQNQGPKSQGKQGINAQYSQADSKNKNDIYKLALGNRTSQKQQKQNSKVDESKQRAQFQTLKSLFKKLQNNT